MLLPCDYKRMKKFCSSSLRMVLLWDLFPSSSHFFQPLQKYELIIRIEIRFLDFESRVTVVWDLGAKWVWDNEAERIRRKDEEEIDGKWVKMEIYSWILLVDKESHMEFLDFASERFLQMRVWTWTDTKGKRRRNRRKIGQKWRFTVGFCSERMNLPRVFWTLPLEISMN